MAAQHARSQSHFRTILVVDDDEQIRNGFARHNRVEQRVVVAATGQQALEVCAKERPDLAIVDLVLQGESGIDVVRALKEQFPKLVIVLLSGRATVDAAVVALRAGAVDVIEKPATLSEMLFRLEGGVTSPEQVDLVPLDRVNWEHCHRAFRECDGNLSMAARKLGINRATLRRHLARPAPKNGEG